MENLMINYQQVLQFLIANFISISLNAQAQMGGDDEDELDLSGEESKDDPLKKSSVHESSGPLCETENELSDCPSPAASNATKAKKRSATRMIKTKLKISTVNPKSINRRSQYPLSANNNYWIWLPRERLIRLQFSRIRVLSDRFRHSALRKSRVRKLSLSLMLKKIRKSPFKRRKLKLLKFKFSR
jgi:hypothetical protein